MTETANYAIDLLVEVISALYTTTYFKAFFGMVLVAFAIGIIVEIWNIWKPKK